MPEISRTYNNPLASHQARHHHDLRGGTDDASLEPSGGETRAEHQANKPKHPVDEALRPSHVLGGEKNMGAPEVLDVKGQKEGGNLKETLDAMATEEEGHNRSREGKMRSGRLQEGLNNMKGVGGLEGKRSGLEGAGER
ncbi:hypothetical protein QBC45DRAFT_332004 [Copromyces sp. CBS 386.78]|nr:hypothetical protein QBC45DRAFT_332004 [Copromyces sp. CBS 386.78]